MPRRTQHERCIECEEPVKVCALISYYIVGRKPHSGRPSKQVKGTLPSRGYCIQCFMKLAKENGTSKADRLELARRLREL
jgi:hypothetical protein